MTPRLPPASASLARHPELDSHVFLKWFVREMDGLFEATYGWGADWRLYILAPVEVFELFPPPPGQPNEVPDFPCAVQEEEPPNPSAVHPFEGLVGAVFKPWVVGVVVIAETWAYPEDVRAGSGDLGELVEPGRHPRRRRDRVVHLVTRGEREVFLTHPQGGEAEVATDADPGVPRFRGRVSGALRRSLGLPALPPMYPHAACLGRLWAQLAAERVTERVRDGTAVDWRDVDSVQPDLDRRRALAERRPDLARRGWELPFARALAGDAPGVPAEMAEWMGVDLFADWATAQTVPVADSLATIAALGHPRLAARLASEIDALGWEDRPLDPSAMPTRGAERDRR